MRLRCLSCHHSNTVIIPKYTINSDDITVSVVVECPFVSGSFRVILVMLILHFIINMYT